MRIPLVALALLLLFGCITVEYTHVQHRDGTVTITQEIDFTSIIEYMESNGDEELENFTRDLSESCANITRRDPSAQCEYRDGSVLLAKDYFPGEFYTFESRDDFVHRKYKLTVFSLPEISNESDTALSTGEDWEPPLLGSDEAAEDAVGMRFMGFEWYYTVEMPGEITSAPGALSVEKSTARFDTLEFMEQKKTIVVESEELNWLFVLAYGLLAIFIVVFLAFIAMMLMKKRKGR